MLESTCRLNWAGVHLILSQSANFQGGVHEGNQLPLIDLSLRVYLNEDARHNTTIAWQKETRKRGRVIGWSK